MKSLRTIALLLLMTLMLSVPATALYSGLPPVDVRARAAILVDAKTGEILYTHNIHDPRPPASITKVMTCLLVLERGNLEDVVTAGETAMVGLDPEGSTQNIKVGEEMQVRDLLYCAMLSSANEACNILAEYISGSVPAFVELMNERAKEIGMEDTVFQNTHGLPDDRHLTSAYDLYLLCLEGMKSPLFMEIAHTQTYTVGPTNLTPEGRTLYTTNRLISKRQSADYVYAYARGIKTGSTQAAGYCLASSAEKDGLTLISVVLGAEKEEETGLIRSFSETKSLFEWGFDNFTYKQILSKSKPVAEIKLIQGLDADSVLLGPESAVTALVPKSLSPEDIKTDIVLFEPDGTMAPVYKGQVLGKLSLSYEGNEYGTVNLISQVSVERSETERIKSEVVGFVSQPWFRWAVIGVVAAVILYTAVVIVINVRRRRNRATGYQRYKGNKRRRR